MMTPRATRVVLGLALVAVLIAAWFAPPAKDDGVVLSEHSQKTAPSAGVASQTMTYKTAPTLDVSVRGTSMTSVEVLGIRPRIQEDEDDEQDSKLFVPTRWASPVKKMLVSVKPVEVAAVPPKAPPLPFRVLGRYDEDGQTFLFLQHFEKNLVVRVGDTIAEQYKVESLQGTTLSLRYIPLDQIQTLEVGGAQ